MKLIMCQWMKLNLLKIQEKKLFNPIGSVEIYFTTWAEEADEATKLEYSASNIENCTVANVAQGEAAKDFKIGTDTGMKKYMRCDKCEKYLSLIPLILQHAWLQH